MPRWRRYSTRSPAVSTALANPDSFPYECDGTAGYLQSKACVHMTQCSYWTVERGVAATVCVGVVLQTSLGVLERWQPFLVQY